MNLQQIINKKLLPKTAGLLAILSCLLILSSIKYTDHQLLKRHKIISEEFFLDINDSIDSLASQVKDLSNNDLIINSLIDDRFRSDYLPVFFRSLSFTVKENISIVFTDFEGEIIAGKNTPDFIKNNSYFEWKNSVFKNQKQYVQ